MDDVFRLLPQQNVNTVYDDVKAKEKSNKGLG